MSQQRFDEMHHAHQWLATVQAQQSFALSMARVCGGEFADLLLGEIQKCTEQPCPQTPNELALRQRQAAASTLKASAIVHAHAVAKQTPGAAPSILAETHKLCAAAPPCADVEFRLVEQNLTEFVGQISKLSAADWSPQI